MSTLFVLGNGFDLDLGLKTSYNDYLTSDEFKNIGVNKCDCRYLAEFVYDIKKSNEKDENHWFDLEQLVGDYYNSLLHPKQSILGNFIDNYNKNIYDEFLKSINDFILKVKNGPIVLYNSVTGQTRASALIKYISNLHLNNLQFDIYNFNYTSELVLIPLINQCLNGSHENIDIDKIYSIHGNVTENFNPESASIVVGTSDSYLKNPNAGFVKKSNQSSKITGRFKESILNNYKRFVIFGHSLGEMDHSYFSPIFENILNRINNPELIIFTKDGNENIIREQISKILNTNLDTLTNSIDLKVNHDIKKVLKY